MTETGGLPYALYQRAQNLGHLAGRARSAGRAYDRCPWSLTDLSNVRARQAAAWYQAFEISAHLPG